MEPRLIKVELLPHERAAINHGRLCLSVSKAEKKTPVNS